MHNAMLQGGGETGALIRALDWSRTPLGPIERWPSSLKTTVGVMLHSRHPMFLWWGPELIQLYNDAYVPSFGVGKHPAALGQRGRDCWQEIWPIIGPQIEQVMNQGVPTWHEDHLVPIFRNGRIEEVFWTYGYSPVLGDDARIGGTLVVCTETTTRVLAERRMRLLRTLADAIARPGDSGAMLAEAADALAGHREDAPFALWYAPSNDPAASFRAVHLDADAAAAVDRAIRPHLGGAAVHVRIGDALPAGITLPGGPWPEAVTEAFVVPLDLGERRDGGHLVVGLSPRLPFDDRYRTLLDQIGEAIALGHQRLDAWHVRQAVEGERNNLLMQAPVGTAVMVGPDHVFQLANPLYCQVVGRSDLIGKAYLEAFPELIGTELPAVLDRVYQTGEPFVASEYPAPLDRRGDGVLEECYFKFNLEAMRDARGRVYGMMAVAADVTEQVLARRQLERAHLDREVLVRELEAANRSKDEFLAMLGHELRNPLSPIVTTIEVMKLRGGGVVAPELRMIEGQVHHLTRLVDDLLDVARITRGNVALRRERIELAAAVARAIETASPLFERARHVLAVEVPPDGLAIDADPTRIAQVLANLLTNAAKYTPAGGKIAVRAAREDDRVVVRVSDDGVGIPPDMLPRVFEPFIQVRQDAARADGGLGLGLAIVKNLVELHGGTVTAASAGRGHGTEITVRLPVASAAAAHRPAATAPLPTAATGAAALRILVVDDNEEAAESLADVLGELGYIVQIAHDGPSALRTVADHRPSIALLDIGLPVMDGYELAGRLRADPRLAGIRLVAITGYGLDDDRTRSRAAGFHAHLVKPVSIDALLRTIGALAGAD